MGSHISSLSLSGLSITVKSGNHGIDEKLIEVTINTNYHTTHVDKL